MGAGAALPGAGRKLLGDMPMPADRTATLDAFRAWAAAQQQADDAASQARARVQAQLRAQEQQMGAGRKLLGDMPTPADRTATLDAFRARAAAQQRADDAASQARARVEAQLRAQQQSRTEARVQAFLNRLEPGPVVLPSRP